MRWSCALTLLLSLVILGVLAWLKLSNDALSLIVGLVVGVLVSAPAWVLAFIGLRRASKSPEQMSPLGRTAASPWPHGQPPVLIISPGQRGATGWDGTPLNRPRLPLSVEEYPGRYQPTHIIGDEDDDDFAVDEWRD